MPQSTRRIVLARRPSGLPEPSDFRIEGWTRPDPQDGELAVRVLYLSVDPYQRGRMRNVRSYVRPLEIGEVVEAAVVAQVTASRHPRFQEGDVVHGSLGWQEEGILSGDQARKLDPDPDLLPAALGVLGMPGLTAYIGLLDVGRPKEGETVLVSGAAGAVGSTVGQIAKIKGCRAVGIAGSDEKVRSLCGEFGFDGAVNYRTSRNLRKDLKALCPGGVDVYFDNVGGPVSDAAVTLINRGARIPICGQISTLNRERPEMGPRSVFLYLLVNRARMEGFLVRDHADRYAAALDDLTRWVREGRIRHRETVTDGFENTVDAFIGLFRGENVGKQLVRVAKPA